MKPRLTAKVKHGLWLIVARSGTLWAAQERASNLEPEDEEAVRAAGRYAEAHWAETQKEDCDDRRCGDADDDDLQNTA